tara:strand:+ start:2139 stop:3119 length:981 start_codon:yes stop_codon:yes gene_type:complete
MPSGDIYNLKGFDSVFSSTLNNEIQDNLLEFFDWSLLEKGNYFNVTLSEASPRGNDYSRLRLSSNDQYSAGQVWEGFRSNWVWQSGVSYSPNPLVGTNNVNPGVSGVYVNSVFYPSSGTGSYAHKIDHFHGRVIFDSAIPTGSVVQAEYSYKWINVVYANSVPWLREVQYRTYEPNSEFLSASKGPWDKPPEARLQLPAIAIEIVPRREMRGYQLGGGQWITTDVLFHCIAEDDITRNRLVDMISLQNEKTIYMFDSNSISSGGDFPIDHLGVVNSGAMRYPDLIQNHFLRRLRFKSTSIQGMDMINSNLYGGIVKLAAEVIDTTI